MLTSRATIIALLVSFASLIITLVSLTVVVMVSSNQGRSTSAAQKPDAQPVEQVSQSPKPAQSSPVPAQTRPALVSTSLSTPTPAVPTITAPNEIADYARSVIEQSKCKDCECTGISMTRVARKSLTEQDKANQITEAWCFQVYYSKKVCKWEDMATTLSIRKVRGLLQAAQMDWGDFDKCLMSGP